MPLDSVDSVPIGMAVQSVVARLPRILGLGEADTCYFVRYFKAPGAMRRADNTRDLPTKVAAWLHHSEPDPSDIAPVQVRAFDEAAIRLALQEASAQNKALAIASRCKLASGATLQAPMVDFVCDPTFENIAFVSEAFRQLGAPGLVVRSEHSLHFYGTRLVEESEWRRFLAQCLLLKDYVDARYIAHCLMYGMSSLRIPSVGDSQRTVVASVPAKHGIPIEPQ